MANEEHLAKLREGAQAWNAWRKRNPLALPDLGEADLLGANLAEADLSAANLRGARLNGADVSSAKLRNAKLTGANLSEAILQGADLSKAILMEAKLDGTVLRFATLYEATLFKTNLNGADLAGANLHGAELYNAQLIGANLSEANLSAAALSKADLSDAKCFKTVLSSATLTDSRLAYADLQWARLYEADLKWADLRGANLYGSDLSGANLLNANLHGAKLQGADLSEASMVRADVTAADLNGSRVYGASVWDLVLDAHTSQRDLVITPKGEDAVTVDNVKLAQFIYLLLSNPEIRHVIDTVTSKVVLILGRFTDLRKKVLDALRDELRTRNYTPVVFDFEKPNSRDLTETVMTLAGMARFVIADISAAKSIPQELSLIIPNLPSVPIQPLLLASEEREYAMFEHWKRYPWVLPNFLYEDEAHLLESLSDKVIKPAEQKRQEQTGP